MVRRLIDPKRNIKLINGSEEILSETSDEYEDDVGLTGVEGEYQDIAPLSWLIELVDDKDSSVECGPSDLETRYHSIALSRTHATHTQKYMRTHSLNQSLTHSHRERYI